MIYNIKLFHIFLDRRSDILVKERNNAFINGTSQSINTGESGDETVIELETRIQQSSQTE